MATRGKRLPGAGQTQLSNETHVARPGRRIHTAYSGTQLYPEGHRRARILPVPEAIFWYDLTSAQEARPQPTSDEAKGRRDETKAKHNSMILVQVCVTINNITENSALFSHI